MKGHPDHGKTSLLDALSRRHEAKSGGSKDLISQEFGGITQHVGAFAGNSNVFAWLIF